MKVSGLGWRVAAAMALGAASQALAGCNGFFVYPGSTTSGSTGTANTGDFAYVSNPAGGNLEVAAYTISSSGLTAISGSPFNLGIVPAAMKVSPSNAFLYVASESSTTAGVTTPAGLYRYTISSTGGLSSGTELAAGTNIAAMDISPDGNYLYTIDTTGTTLTQYTLNTTTGAYTAAVTTSTPGSTSLFCLPISTSNLPATQSCSVAVSPSGTYLGVALNSGSANAKTVIFPYSSSSGITNSQAAITDTDAASGNFSVAFDKSDYLYIAQTASLVSYTAPYVNGAAPVLESSYTNYASGATPRSVVLSKSYSYVYTANEGTSTIAAFSLAGAGQLTLINAAIAGPTSVAALGVDNSGNYLLAAGYNANNGLELFSIGKSGLTTVGATQGTGTSLATPIVMALTH